MDTTGFKTDSATLKSIKKSKIIPRVSTLHSLMIPGWGQINNRQYWKLPIAILIIPNSLLKVQKSNLRVNLKTSTIIGLRYTKSLLLPMAVY